ncbi:hypothetical protein CASFOL_018020 [Castilleja foliolosa]|uniref:Uncharacterized protein n=1 Tax=Castilleja foliolosa TaxID=1961234 RepID=A0ABD3D786_9LAMI
MERSEPTLVPEWLKNAGSSNGGGSTTHTDVHTASRVFARNKSFVNSNGYDFGRSSSSERTTSSYFRRSSSSNSSGNSRSYSNFGRNQRDRDWNKVTYDYRDQDKSTKGERERRYRADPSWNNTSVSKFESDELRRSHSLVSGKSVDTFPKKPVSDSIDSNGKNTNGLVNRVSTVGGVVGKAAFERDFPSLGAEERAVTPEAGRVPSPGLSTAIQILPGPSALIGGEKWTSALAEVPMLVGSNGNVAFSVQQAASSSSAPSRASGSTPSLNMAEAVAQGPNRGQAAPQLSDGTQRLEELVIKQSRQLIPVVPSMSKSLALNYSDKQKSKVGQPQHSISSSLPVTHSPRGGPAKADISKASTVGKLHVLKPAREKNGSTPVVKDSLSPKSDIKAVNSPLAANRASPNTTVPDRKPVLTVLEKRPTPQARSRNDFFNLMRKKSMGAPSSSDDSATLSDKNAELEVVPAANNSQAVEAPILDLDEKAESCNGDEKKYVNNGKRRPGSDPLISEEEEAAFLRSLGWEENDEEGGLTDEEISSFYRDLTKYISSKPSLKILQGVQPKFMLPLNSQIEGIDGIPDA